MTVLQLKKKWTSQFLCTPKNGHIELTDNFKTQIKKLDLIRVIC